MFIFANFLSVQSACDSSPCLNGGTCTNLAGGKYSCQCKRGWKGSRCEGKGKLFSPLHHQESSAQYFEFVTKTHTLSRKQRCVGGGGHLQQRQQQQQQQRNDDDKKTTSNSILGIADSFNHSFICLFFYLFLL